MKHIEITERGFGFEDRKLLSEDFDQIIFITDMFFGSVGITSFEDVTRAIDAMLDNVALTLAHVNDVPEDERSVEMIEDCAIVKTLLGTNAVSMTLGPIGQEMLAKEGDLSDEQRARYEEMVAIAEEAKALGKRAIALSNEYVIDRKCKEDED